MSYWTCTSCGEVGNGFEDMKLCEFIKPETIHLHVPASSKTVLLKHLSQLASKAANLPSATIMLAINDRERLGSTGLGGGVAIPHARVRGLQQILVLVAVLDQPCDFEALDGKPVDLLLLLLVPDHPLISDYRLLLGQAVTRLSRPAFTDKIRDATSSDAVCQLFASDGEAGFGSD